MSETSKILTCEDTLNSHKTLQCTETIIILNCLFSIKKKDQSFMQIFCCSSEEEEPEKMKPNKGEDVPKGQRSKHIHANQKVYYRSVVKG